MAKNGVRTSEKVASKAAKLLKKAKDIAMKEVAGSDLVNRKEKSKK